MKKAENKILKFNYDKPNEEIDAKIIVFAFDRKEIHVQITGEQGSQKLEIYCNLGGSLQIHPKVTNVIYISANEFLE